MNESELDQLCFVAKECLFLVLGHIQNTVWTEIELADLLELF
jgi:hypothetical protein